MDIFKCFNHLFTFAGRWASTVHCDTLGSLQCRASLFIVNSVMIPSARCLRLRYVSVLCLSRVSSPVHTADATHLSSWVSSAVCTEFAASWQQFWQVKTNLPTTKSSCVMSAVWTHPSAVVSQFIISCAVGEKWRHNDVIVEKAITIDQNSRSQTVIFSFQIADRIHRQPWASCEFYSHCWREATRQFGHVGVSSVYRVSVSSLNFGWRLIVLVVRVMESLCVCAVLYMMLVSMVLLTDDRNGCE